MTSSIATATRRRWPPERRLTSDVGLAGDAELIEHLLDLRAALGRRRRRGGSAAAHRSRAPGRRSAAVQDVLLGTIAEAQAQLVVVLVEVAPVVEHAVPAVAGRKPVSAFSSVDLPAPDGPTTARNERSSRLNVTSLQQRASVRRAHLEPGRLEGDRAGVDVLLQAEPTSRNVWCPTLTMSSSSTIARSTARPLTNVPLRLFSPPARAGRRSAPAARRESARPAGRRRRCRSPVAADSVRWPIASWIPLKTPLSPRTLNSMAPPGRAARALGLLSRRRHDPQRLVASPPWVSGVSTPQS